MVSTDQIFAGNLFITTDGFLLILPQDSPLNGDTHGLIDVDLDPSLASRLDQAFDRQDVSVLGHIGSRSIGAEQIRTLVVTNVVLKSDVALRALEFSRFEDTGSPTDNWLRAERDLLLGSISSRS